MKLEKAIELIQKDIDDPSVDWDTRLGYAYKLSFEALRRVGDMRKSPCTTADEILPGETE
ncbi:hypothetical protein LCGC14_2650870 [marine sediment metagenome]|uniref:Uncharacterized protein n=1 Tax=marine sediment metagenome TaxID=412755 RepID=A0A0F9AH47_9ZZZZ